MNIGQITTASWVATSTAANGVKLTDTLNLQKGVYIISIMYPILSSDTAQLCTPHINRINITNYYMRGSTSNVQSFAINLPVDSTFDLVSASSAPITYSYIERGRVQAIKIK